MIEQRFHLDYWDWDIIVLYDVTVSDAPYVLSLLRDAGCGHMRDSMDNLLSGRMNTGLTNTNPRDGITVIVLGRTTSPAQFYNSIEHERGHAVEHIAWALDIPYSGEEIQYLRGEISQRMYPVAVKFLCRECFAESVRDDYPPAHLRR